MTRTALLRLVRNDLTLVRRDSFLAGLLLYIAALAVLTRVYVPLLQRELLARGYFDLEPYYPLLASYVAVLLGTMMVGIFIAFLLIDERDHRTLTALLVTPLPFPHYLAYRVALPVALAVPLVVALFEVVDLAPLPAWQLWGIALASSPLAAVTTLVLPTFADNKVQAFALAKILSGTALVPVAAFFVDEPWQYLAGLYPPYWAVKAFWVLHAGEAGAWLHLLAAAVSGTLVAWWLAVRFERVARS